MAPSSKVSSGGGGGDVAELGEEVGTLGAAGGVDLDDLPAGDPPDGVEVVHAAVAEDAAGDLDVLAWRGCGVQGGGPHGVHPAELPGLHGGPGCAEGRVEAARVADLHRYPAVGHVPGDGHGLGEVAGQRLLAEHRDAGVDPGPDQLRCGRRWPRR